MKEKEEKNKLYLKLYQSLFADLSAVIAREVSEQVQRYLDLPLTVEQVAMLLDVQPDVIYKWHQRGRLNFTKKCGRLTITLQEVNHQLTNKDAIELLREKITCNSDSLQG